MSERTRPATPAERNEDVKKRIRAIEYGYSLGLHTKQKRDELIAALDDFDGYPRPLPPMRDRARLRARFVSAGRPRLRARVRKPTRPAAPGTPLIVQVPDEMLEAVALANRALVYRQPHGVLYLPASLSLPELSDG